MRTPLITVVLAAAFASTLCAQEDVEIVLNSPQVDGNSTTESTDTLTISGYVRCDYSSSVSLTINGIAIETESRSVSEGYHHDFQYELQLRKPNTEILIEADSSPGNTVDTLRFVAIYQPNKQGNDAWILAAVLAAFMLLIVALLFAFPPSRNSARSKRSYKTAVVTIPSPGDIVAPPILAQASVAATPTLKELRVFISYRRADAGDVVGRIFDRLVHEFGIENVFKDVDSIPLGVDFREHVQSVVSKSSVVLAVIGPDWAGVSRNTNRPRLQDEEDLVRIEIECAIEMRIPLIPLFVRNGEFPENGVLPDTLRPILRRNGMPVRQDPDFHRDLDRLISGMKRHLI